ncbi:MAG: hypothetical protein OCD00_00220 [Colwellia sp.]
MEFFTKYLTKTLFLVATLTVTLALTVNANSAPIDDSSVDNLPLPSILFAKHIEAIGGEQSIAAHTISTVNSKLIINAYGIEGSLQVIAAAPNKLTTTVELGPLGVSRSGFNGSVGWSMNAMSGNELLEGEALHAMIMKADFYADNLHLANGVIKQKTVEIATFADGKHYRVLLVNAKGEESFLFFSTKTGLLSGMDRMEQGASGSVPTQIRLGNYVEFDGMKTARRVSSSQNGVETIIEITAISYNELAPNAFDLPVEIQAMINE